MKQLAIRLIRVLIGFVINAFSIYLVIQADIGFSPWDTFTFGVANITGFLYGDIAVGVSLAHLLIAVILKERVGVTAILNALLVGKIVDVFRYFEPLPTSSNLAVSVLFILLGAFLLSYSTYLYIKPGLGSGPRDALMIALGKRFPRVPIGAVRGSLEAFAFLTGFLLGVKIGIGTVIFVISLPIIMQYTFKGLRFDIKGIKHDDVFDTFNQVKSAFRREKSALPSGEGETGPK